MKQVSILLLVVVLIFAISVFYAHRSVQTVQKKESAQIQKGNMKITSSAFTQKIPSLFTCDGENKNPPFTIADVPQAAKSLVLITDDPDAPTGTFVHWVVYNISPKVTEVKEGEVPLNGQQGKNSTGQEQYMGPCPPNGEHRYFFKLYALDSSLTFQDAPTKEQVLDAMQGHIISQTEMIGLYSRQKK